MSVNLVFSVLSIYLSVLRLPDNCILAMSLCIEYVLREFVCGSTVCLYVGVCMDVVFAFV